MNLITFCKLYTKDLNLRNSRIKNISRQPLKIYNTLLRFHNFVFKNVFQFRLKFINIDLELNKKEFHFGPTSPLICLSPCRLGSLF